MELNQLSIHTDASEEDSLEKKETWLGEQSQQKLSMLGEVAMKRRVA